jgi:hypothetical protein
MGMLSQHSAALCSIKVQQHISRIPSWQLHLEWGRLVNTLCPLLAVKFI